MLQSDGLRLTLQLLSGPTKALVASGVGGLALLGSSCCNPALCYVSRLPYDDDVFKVRSLLPSWPLWPCLRQHVPPGGGGHTVLLHRCPSCLQSMHGSEQEKVLASFKNSQRLVGLAGIRRIVSPGNLAVILGRK